MELEQMKPKEAGEMGRISLIVIAVAASTAAAAQDFVATKQVRLTCSTLPYVFDCSIPVVGNPQFTARCFYVAQGQSSLMRADHRMGFSNPIVSLQVNAGMTVTGTVTEKQTGNQSDCSQEDY
jgi:hypothetical protein